jgi:hypothetical protein
VARRIIWLCAVLLLVSVIGFDSPALASPPATESSSPYAQSLGAMPPTTALRVPTTCTVIANANLRAGPGTNWPVAGGVRAGIRITVVGQNLQGNWYRLLTGQWIFAALVRCGPPPSCIEWNVANGYGGQRVCVCGPVVNTNYARGVSGQPTFLDVGMSYPSPSRFDVIIWGEHRSAFPWPPEAHYLGKRICVTGTVEIYKGVPQIEATGPSQIQEPN